MLAQRGRSILSMSRWALWGFTLDRRLSKSSPSASLPPEAFVAPSTISSAESLPLHHYLKQSLPLDIPSCSLGNQVVQSVVLAQQSHAVGNTMQGLPHDKACWW